MGPQGEGAVAGHADDHPTLLEVPRCRGAPQTLVIYQPHVHAHLHESSAMDAYRCGIRGRWGCAPSPGHIDQT